jgi:uncharacterized membrane protein YuzA (DUF378 family)
MGKPIAGKEVQKMAKAALILMVIGALNWLLVGLFQFDVVAMLFGGTTSWLSRAVYTLVGLGGIYGIFMLFDDLKETT